MPIALIMPTKTPTAAAIASAAQHVLLCRGHEAHWPATVDALASAIAYSLFSSMPDPSDGKAVEAVVKDVADIIKRDVEAAVRELEKIG